MKKALVIALTCRARVTYFVLILCALPCIGVTNPMLCLDMMVGQWRRCIVMGIGSLPASHYRPIAIFFCGIAPLT